MIKNHLWHISFSVSLLLLSLKPEAAEISPAQAAVAARHFVAQRLFQGSEPLMEYSPQQVRVISEGQLPCIYVFNIGNDRGFVLIAADDRVFPVLGFSDKGSYDENRMPPAYSGLLDHYLKEIVHARNHDLLPDGHISRYWDALLSGENIPQADNIQGVAPLTTTLWDQGCYYNDSCPEDINSWSCGHVVTGCVATCIAQIMKYHNYPPSGSGSHQYTHPDYGNLGAGFASATYNWGIMPDELTGPDTEVARLMYHVGVGVEMNYGANASGAPSSNAAAALIHFFNYANTLHLIQKADYSTADWLDILRTELNNGRPMYYAGYGSVGHAFVCDGFQDPDFFHFNWGWSGSQNGYFYLNNLNPGFYTFNDYQEAIVGIAPGVPANCSGNTLLTAPAGDFTDGSYGASYQNNASCQWLIQPGNSPAWISLEFLTFNTQAGSDLVRVYDGNTTAAPLIVTFSGNSLPPVVAGTAPAMLVQFTSDGNITAAGWSAHYRTNYCYPLSTLTQAGGSFSDGSGSLNYFDETSCQWLIQQPANTIIALNFTAFETEYGYDFVDVYDGPTTNDPLLGHFSGDTLPPVLFSGGNAMLIHFYCDQGVVDAGWDAVYATSVGIDSEKEEKQLRLYPNPAGDKLYLSWKGISEKLVSGFVTDLSGRIVVPQDYFSLSSAGNNIILDVSGLVPGLYFLKISDGKQQVVGRFAKR